MDQGKRFVEDAYLIEDELLEIRRRFHKYPELSNREYATTDFIKSKLLEYGIEVEAELPGTGVIGIIRGGQPGRTIGLRADIDALPISENTGLEFSSENPGVMHACGHDIHATVVLGCAKLLNGRKKDIKGNIKLIFQPAEELGEGARYLIEQGVLDNPRLDGIMALHCWPEIPTGTIGIRHGAIMASADTIKIRIHGKQAHAAHPHMGVDPIVIAAQVINGLQTIATREISPTDPVVITIGQIHGGTASNIIPNLVELTGTVRTMDSKTREAMPIILDRCVKGIARSMKGDAEVEYNFETVPVISDERMIETIIRSVQNTIGEENLVMLNKPSMGTEDFGLFLERVPGILFRLGTYAGELGQAVPLHNSKLILDERSIAIGVSVMSYAACDFLAEPQEPIEADEGRGAV